MTIESNNSNPLVTVGSSVDVWIVLLIVLMFAGSAFLIWGHFAKKNETTKNIRRS